MSEFTLAAAWRGSVNGVATCATMRSESVTRQPVKAWPASTSFCRETGE